MVKNPRHISIPTTPTAMPKSQATESLIIQLPPLAIAYALSAKQPNTTVENI